MKIRFVVYKNKSKKVVICKYKIFTFVTEIKQEN